MELSTPGAVNSMAKYHFSSYLVHGTKGISAVTMELPIIGIWYIASASKLSINSITRQQWNFHWAFGAL